MLCLLEARAFTHTHQSMNHIKFSTLAITLSSVCVITNSTVANAQNARRIEIPKICSNELINRGAFSDDPSVAVRSARTAWDRLARQRGYFSFAGAKTPQVRVVVYPRPDERGKWKANVIAYPCKFMQLPRN